MALRKNYFYQVILSGVNILYPLITFPYVARVLQPEGLGEAQFSFNFALYFSVIASFGIPFYGIKEIGRCGNDQRSLNKTFSELFGINIITSIICLGIYFLVLFTVPKIDIQLDFALICAALIFFTPLNIDWLFSGLQQFKTIALRAVSIKLIALVLLFSLVNSKEDLLLYLIILTFSYIGNYLVNVILAKKRVSLSFHRHSFKRHRKPLLFILSSTFATTIYTSLDSVVLGLLSDNYQVGLYSAGVKLAKVSIPIVTGLSAVIIPGIAQAIKEKNLAFEAQMVAKSFSFIVFLGIPIATGLYVFREPFIEVLLGSEYLEAKPSMAYLSFLPLFIGLGYLFGLQILVPNNLNKSLFTATSLGVVVFIIANIILTPKLGATGAAIAILLTELIVTTGYIYFTPKYLLKELPYKDMLYAIIASIIFFFIHYTLTFFEMHSITNLSLSIVLSASSYFLIQHYIFSNALVQTMINTFQSKLRR